MRPAETIPEMGGEGIKENDRRVYSTMIYLIYCKNFCKCHNVPQHKNNNLKKCLPMVLEARSSSPCMGGFLVRTLVLFTSSYGILQCIHAEKEVTSLALLLEVLQSGRIAHIAHF
jgi:hypothetical protein